MGFDLALNRKEYAEGKRQQPASGTPERGTHLAVHCGHTQLNTLHIVLVRSETIP